MVLEELCLLSWIMKEHAESTQLNDDKRKKFSKCKNVSVQNVGDEFLEYVKNNYTPYQMYEASQTAFSRKVISSQIYLRKNFQIYVMMRKCHLMNISENSINSFVN